jgi:hypothetical protein
VASSMKEEKSDQKRLLSMFDSKVLSLDTVDMWIIPLAGNLQSLTPGTWAWCPWPLRKATW